MTNNPADLTAQQLAEVEALFRDFPNPLITQALREARYRLSGEEPLAMSALDDMALEEEPTC